MHNISLSAVVCDGQNNSYGIRYCINADCYFHNKISYRTNWLDKTIIIMGSTYTAHIMRCIYCIKTKTNTC